MVPQRLSPLVRRYATLSTTSTASTPQPPPPPPPQRAKRPPTQPSSHKSHYSRKTQLHRSYLSLLRSTPLMLFFQHNNIRAEEWIAIRRELLFTLESIDRASTAPQTTRITVLRPALFAAAMRVAEGWDPVNRSAGVRAWAGTSGKVHKATKELRDTHPLSPVLTGPVAALSFPYVEPRYLKAALEVLFPLKNPKKGMDPLAVGGVQKFVLLAGRVDGHVYGGRNGQGRVLDGPLIRQLATLPDVDSLRGQLLALLIGAGGSDLVMNLSSVGVGLTRTVDARRKMLGGELDTQGKEGGGGV